MSRAKLKLDEHDQKGKKHERLDQRQGDDHHRLDGAGSTRITGRTLGRTRADEALTDTG